MPNQIKMKIIETIDKFIIYMLTENDKKKSLYSQLITLEGEELSDWINDSLKDYLADGYGLEEEVRGCEITKWIENISDIYIGDIFNGRVAELIKIQKELIEYNNDCDCFEDCFKENYVNINFKVLMEYYCFMYICKMSANELKDYIINLIDPVEPK
jgi:hypothetical protein